MRLRGGRSWIIGGTSPLSRRDPVLIRALRAAHAMLGTDDAGLPVIEAAPPSPYLRRLVRLAFLAPDLQRAILAGRQPPGLTLEQLMRTPMPGLWSEQGAMIEALGSSWRSAGSRLCALLIRRWALLRRKNALLLANNKSCYRQ